MKVKREIALTVRCPTCGAKPGENCELGTGQPRTEPHRDRRLAALDKLTGTAGSLSSTCYRSHYDQQH